MQGVFVLAPFPHVAQYVVQSPCVLSASGHGLGVSACGVATELGVEDQLRGIGSEVKNIGASCAAGVSALSSPP